MKFLGARAERPLATVQPVHVEQFKAHLAGRVGASMVNKSMRVLKGAFGSAVAKRQLEFSPAEHVEFNEAATSQRRAFTLAEIKSLLTVAEGDWRTMVLLGLYSGQRLQDCARLGPLRHGVCRSVQPRASAIVGGGQTARIQGLRCKFQVANAGRSFPVGWCGFGSMLWPTVSLVIRLHHPIQTNAAGTKKHECKCATKDVLWPEQVESSWHSNQEAQSDHPVSNFLCRQLRAVVCVGCAHQVQLHS